MLATDVAIACMAPTGAPCSEWLGSSFVHVPGSAKVPIGEAPIDALNFINVGSTLVF